MHVLSRKKLREFWTDYTDSEEWLNGWFKKVSKVTWNNFAEVRAMYPAADWVDGYVVFDVCGNKYRMITQIYFDTNDVLVRHVLTHKEYDKGDWKK